MLELVLFFHYMGHKDQTQVVRLSGRHFYSRSSKKLLSYSQYAYVYVYGYVGVYMCACIISFLAHHPGLWVLLIRVAGYVDWDQPNVIFFTHLKFEPRLVLHPL